MNITHGIKLFLVSAALVPLLSFASTDNKPVDDKLTATIAPQIFEIAKKNENWKQAFKTGKEAQVVFMNVTPKTNPKNEIGMETHKFDQVIFVVEGKAKSVLNDKNSTVKAGDMVFIPQGVPHNFINLDSKKPFKIISIYSATDIPEKSAYKQMSDVPKE